MYPIVLINLSPLSGRDEAPFPQLILSSGWPCTAESNPGGTRITITFFIWSVTDPLLQRKLDHNYNLHWILRAPCCSLAVKRPRSRAAFSGFHNPAKCLILSVSYQWLQRRCLIVNENKQIHSVLLNSYRDRSWRRVCPSRSVVWFLVSQIQSLLQQGCINFYLTNTLSCTGMYSGLNWLQT